MSSVVQTDELSALRAEIASLREALTAKAAADALYRYHCLDGIRDDSCPSCGGRIRVVDNGYQTGVRLEAVPW